MLIIKLKLQLLSLTNTKINATLLHKLSKKTGIGIIFEMQPNSLLLHMDQTVLFMPEKSKHLIFEVYY